MRRIIRGGLRAAGLCIALFALMYAEPIVATTTKSQNYEAIEAEFGSGAALETCSGSYCAKATLSIGGGDSSSQSYSVDFGPLTDDDEPVLQMVLEPGESNLGDLQIDRTATRTMILKVRSHLAGGYIVQVTGNTPRYNDYYLAAPIEPTPSLVGTEQFGINLVANSEPQVGVNPVQLPSEQEIKGVVLPRYAVPNMFAYTNGDPVARMDSESSLVRYTISMIVNVSGTTPAGHFSGDFSTIVTPVF